ncbi:7606_t:CDS:1, partial [Ambispora leptoticha]
MSSNKKTTTSKNKKNKTPNYSKSKRQYKPREFLSYDETWGKMSKENLERDRDNDDNDWLNPGQREEMLDQ